MDLDDSPPERNTQNIARTIAFRQRHAVKGSPRLTRSPYPIVSMDTWDDLFVVRVAYARDDVVEFSVGYDWEKASHEFRRIAD